MMLKTRPLTLVLLLSVASATASATGAGLEIRDTFYCGDDFSMLMSNGERWVVRKADVGEQKLSRLVAMALFMVATGKKTANIFPADPVNWCGNSGVRPITILSFTN